MDDPVRPKRATSLMMGSAKSPEEEEIDEAAADPNDKTLFFPHHEKRKRVRQEIVDTEKSYVNSLTLLHEHYVTKIRKLRAAGQSVSMGATDEDLDTLVSNIETLSGVHKAFLLEIESRPSDDLPKILLNYAEFFKMYTAYLNQYEAVLHVLTKLKANKKFDVVLNDIEQSLRDKGGLDLMSYLIMPVQRIPRYVLLLTELLRSSSKNHPSYPALSQALDKFQTVAAHVNEGKKKAEVMTKLMQIQDTLEGVPPDFKLVQPSRQIILEGDVLVVMHSNNKKSSMKHSVRHIYLFTDIILLTKKGHWKDVLTLSACKLELVEGNTTDFGVQTSKEYFIFRCNTPEDRELWVSSVTREVESLKKLRERRRSLKKTSLNRGTAALLTQLQQSAQESDNLSPSLDSPAPAALSPSSPQAEGEGSSNNGQNTLAVNTNTTTNNSSQSSPNSSSPSTERPPLQKVQSLAAKFANLPSVIRAAEPEHDQQQSSQNSQPSSQPAQPQQQAQAEEPRRVVRLSLKNRQQSQGGTLTRNFVSRLSLGKDQAQQQQLQQLQKQLQNGK